MINKVIPLRPKKLFVCISAHNDSNAMRYEGSYWNDNRLKTPIIPCDFDGLELEKIDYSDVDIMLEIVRSICISSGIELFIATQPFRQNYLNDSYLSSKYSSQIAFDKVCKGRRVINELVRTFSHKNNVSFIDLELELQSYTNIYSDELHLNERGSELLASILYREMA